MTIDKATEEKIIKGYNLFGGNAVKAANYAEVTPPTVRRKWKENNLATDIHRNKPLSDYDKFLILNAYHCFDGHATAASEYLHRGLSTVWELWRKFGLRANGKNRFIKFKYGKKERAEIADILIKTNYSAVVTADIYGCSDATVRKIARERGIPVLRQKRRKKSELEKIIS